MSDLLSASSLLVAIAAILFSLWYADIVKALEIRPKPHEEDNIAPRLAVSGVLSAKALPVAVMSTLVAAVFFPDALSLTLESADLYQIHGLSALRRYDAVRTAYCLVTILASVLALYMWVLVLRLLRLRRKLR